MRALQTTARAGLSGAPLMTAPRARVRERLPRDGHELPRICAGTKREPQHTVGRVVPDLAVGLNGAELVERTPPGTDSELADAIHRVAGCVRVLGSEALVHVLVAVQDQLSAVLMQRIPERTDGRIVAVARAG